MSRLGFEPRSVCLLCPYPYNPPDRQHLFETSPRASGLPLSIATAHPGRGGQSLVCWTDHCPSLGLRWTEEANLLATRHNLEGPADTHPAPIHRCKNQGSERASDPPKGTQRGRPKRARPRLLILQNLRTQHGSGQVPPLASSLLVDHMCSDE